jgi:hypothetical protein
MMTSPPPPWRFHCYVSEDGTDEIRTWYEAQSKRLQQKFLDRMLALRGLPPEEWTLPLFRWLRGDGQGLGEIRFKSDGVQQRPLGFRGPEADLFTLLYPAREKKDRFMPKNAIAIAQGLRKQVESNKERSNDLWLFRDS